MSHLRMICDLKSIIPVPYSGWIKSRVYNVCSRLIRNRTVKSNKFWVEGIKYIFIHMKLPIYELYTTFFVYSGLLLTKDNEDTFVSYGYANIQEP